MYLNYNRKYVVFELCKKKKKKNCDFFFLFLLVISVEFLYNSVALTNISAKKTPTRSRQRVRDKLTVEFFLETWEYFMDSDNMADLTGDFGTLPQAEDTGRTLV